MFRIYGELTLSFRQVEAGKAEKRIIAEQKKLEAENTRRINAENAQLERDRQSIAARTQREQIDEVG